LERNNNPQRHLRADQQTTSGDSDVSDNLPMGKKGNVFQRVNQFRSVSSVDNSINNRGRSSLLTTVPQKAPNYLAQRLKNGVEVSTSNAEEETDLNDIELHSPNAKSMTLHTRECVEQMQHSCDKLIHAKQMIEKDNAITDQEREKLLRSVFKSINQFRQRLENSLPEDRTFSDMTMTTTNGSGSLKNVGSSGRPSSMSNAQQDMPNVVNDDFIKKHGPQLMKLLQDNMARNN